MSLISDRKIIYINSGDRINGTTSDFRVNLPINTQNNYDYCAVLQCLIPQSYWLVRSGQNTFKLIENGSEKIVALPVGNYNRKSLAATLSAALTVVGDWNYEVTYPMSNLVPDTGLYTYTVTGNTSQPSFKFEKFCFEPLGFDKNSIVTFVSNSLTSKNVPKLLPEDQLFLHSDMCSNKSDDILQDIYAGTSASYSAILFQNFDVESYAKEIVNNQINSYRFYLTNEDDQIIDLNGNNMTITLILFKRNAAFKKLEGAINYYLTMAEEN